MTILLIGARGNAGYQKLPCADERAAFARTHWAGYKPVMHAGRPITCAAAVLIVLCTAFLRAAEPAKPLDLSKLPPPADRRIDFVRDVQPILASSCHSCHGPQKQKGNYRLDVKSVALSGGREARIVPGDSAHSLLIHYVSGLHEEIRMPPKGPPLSVEQVGILRAWIDQGATWPDSASAPLNAADHWSLKPVQTPPVPDVQTYERWGRNPIDQFVLARLAERGLRPAPEADRRTLIRRVYFDLIGLPPSPEEIDAFVADPDSRAYEKLVDKLLESPRFGERWARHWLDAVRFADTHGFEMNQPRPTAWPYRDYVIRAFNDDKPYDRFVLEQLAGDALGADEGTGFLVAGPWDQVKSPDPNLTAQQRLDELHDMVSATAATFLGLTVGCARCHDHKFDPIPQTDYYRMQAVFAGVMHGEREWRGPESEQRKRRLEELRPQLAAIESQLAQYEPIANVSDSAPRRPPVHPARNVDRFEATPARYVRFTVERTTDLEPCIDELEIFTAGEQPRNVALASAGTRASSSGNYAGSDLHKLEHLVDGRYGNSRSWISNQSGKGWVVVELPEVARIDRVVWARDREGKFSDRLPLQYRIEVATELGKWQVVAMSADRAPYKKGAPAPELRLEFLPQNQRETASELLGRRNDLDKSIRELSASRMVYAGRFEQPGPSYRLERGEANQRREAVTAGGLSCLPSPPNLTADAPERQRRLALARWIVEPGNPLPARVIVNRLWQYHFGQGIVATPSDFGRMGARPTHPELLDWLAAELTGSAWRLKHIHRLIVLSSTYRQAHCEDASAASIDAGNSLLWRWPRRRLEAEAIRDAILCVSGKLDLTPGGPGFDVFEPNDNYVRVYTPKEEFGPREWRRMIFQFKPRLQQDGVFGAFDCPDAGQTAPRRFNSTTPLQALNLLNSRFMLQQSDYFAQRVRRDAGDVPAAQVRRAFLLAFGREPTEIEITPSLRLIEQHGLAALCRALYNANEFLYVF
jgi:Protein of unknown function (DUF1549)/Protein of unknown function (DUF1553)/Planctomycete cytochrome C